MPKQISLHKYNPRLTSLGLRDIYPRLKWDPSVEVYMLSWFFKSFNCVKHNLVVISHNRLAFKLNSVWLSFGLWELKTKLFHVWRSFRSFSLLPSRSFSQSLWGSAGKAIWGVRAAQGGSWVFHPNTKAGGLLNDAHECMRTSGVKRNLWPCHKGAPGEGSRMTSQKVTKEFGWSFTAVHSTPCQKAPSNYPLTWQEGVRACVRVWKLRLSSPFHTCVRHQLRQTTSLVLWWMRFCMRARVMTYFRILHGMRCLFVTKTVTSYNSRTNTKLDFCGEVEEVLGHANFAM